MPKCEHGLKPSECFVCVSPKVGERHKSIHDLAREMAENPPSDFTLGVRFAATLDLTEAIFAGAKATGASKRLSMHDLRQMSLAAKERIMALALRIESGCCNCDDGWFYDGFNRDRCDCTCHSRETTR